MMNFIENNDALTAYVIDRVSDAAKKLGSKTIGINTKGDKISFKEIRPENNAVITHTFDFSKVCNKDDEFPESYSNQVVLSSVLAFQNFTDEDFEKASAELCRLVIEKNNETFGWGIGYLTLSCSNDLIFCNLCKYEDFVLDPNAAMGMILESVSTFSEIIDGICHILKGGTFDEYIEARNLFIDEIYNEPWEDPFVDPEDEADDDSAEDELFFEEFELKQT